MRKFIRLPAPEVLVLNAEQWGTEWAARREADKGAAFHWHSYAGQQVNHIILPILREQTQSHCSFCDGFPISPPGVETIEHFRPKSHFPREAYEWPNLYLCCPFCQQKGNAFDQDVLRPDGADFEFDRYFRWDFTTGEIGPNPAASEDFKRKALATINAYRLNDQHPSLRKQWAHRWLKLRDQEDVNNLPYRSYLQS